MFNSLWSTYISWSFGTLTFSINSALIYLQILFEAILSGKSYEKKNS